MALETNTAVEQMLAVQDPSGNVQKPANANLQQEIREYIADVRAALASQGGDTLRVEQQTPVAVENSAGTNIDPATEATQQAVADQTGNFGSGTDGDATDDTTGSTLPSNAVAPGVSVLVQAKPGNTDPVKVGLTSTPTVSVPAGSSVSYRVQNTDQIHILANTDGDGVNFTTEQEA